MPLASVLALGVLGWWLLRPAAAPPEPVAQAPLSPPVAAPAPARQEVAPINFSPDGVPIRPAGSAEVNAEGMQPHAITPTHERIYAENNLIGSLNGAMDVKDGPGLRRLLKQYRDQYPEDAHVLQDGYELIANCLEQPSADNRAIAQRYYDEQLDSGLRRYIRRHCLEAINP